jgi:hypothetical protein
MMPNEGRIAEAVEAVLGVDDRRFAVKLRVSSERLREREQEVPSDALDLRIKRQYFSLSSACWVGRDVGVVAALVVIVSLPTDVSLLTDVNAD